MERLPSVRTARTGLIVAALALTAAAAHAQAYVLDDGTAESAVGLPGIQDFIVLNAFRTDPEHSVITTLSYAFGSPDVPAPNADELNGSTFTAVLWSDPNGDSSPRDAVVLATATGTMRNVNTNTFVSVSIDPTQVTTPYFFVGYMFSKNLPDMFPAAIDMNGSAGLKDSWDTGGAFGTGNIHDLQANQLRLESVHPNGVPANWLIRADGVAPVSEPATAWMLAAGIGALAFGRRLRAAGASAISAEAAARISQMGL